MFRPASRSARRYTLLAAAMLLATAPILAALAQSPAPKTLIQQPPRSQTSATPAQQHPGPGGPSSVGTTGDGCTTPECRSSAAADAAARMPASRADVEAVAAKLTDLADTLGSFRTTLEDLKKTQIESLAPSSSFTLFITVLLVALAVIIAIWTFGRVLFRKKGFSMSGRFIPPVTGGRLGAAGGTSAKPPQPEATDISKVGDRILDQNDQIIEQNKIIISRLERVTQLLQNLFDREEPQSQSYRQPTREGARSAIAVTPSQRSQDPETVSLEVLYTDAARDAKLADEFIKRYRADGWVKRDKQLGSDGDLVKSAKDSQNSDFLVMPAASNSPAQRMVVPGIWYLNNPTALLSDGGRAGRRALDGVFELRDGQDTRLVHVAWGDETSDGIKITQRGLLELPGFGGM